MNSMIAVNTVSSQAPATPARDQKLWALAQDLEASFLAEMLNAAGLGQARGGMGGGPGEDQFSSFLVAEYAEATVRAGGIGLSESIYRALTGSEGAPS